MTSTAKNEVLKELETKHLTRVIGRKPTAFDIDRWEDEASEMVTEIKTRAFPGGMEHGHQAAIISAEEYGLVIGDLDYVYMPPTDPGSYPDVEGDEDEYEIKRLEAEHKEAIADYHRYLGVQEHLRREFQACMDSTWIEPLKSTRGGYAHVTAKGFFAHLRADVAKLTTREEDKMKEGFNLVWDRPEHIKNFFTRMERARSQAERWGVEIEDKDMVNKAVIQMQDSQMFDAKFLRDWERKPRHEQTWNHMKDYFGDEYTAIVQFQPSIKNFESANNLTERGGEQVEITQFFDELRRDAVVGNEQIQQMSESFKNAALTMKEVMERLKTSQEQITTLTATNKTLVETNKQLALALKALGGKAPGTAADGGEEEKKAPASNPKMEPCNICGFPHGKPFAKWCWELEVNKSKRPKNWSSRLGA